MPVVYYFDIDGNQTGVGDSYTVPDGATDKQPPTPEAVWDGENWVGQTITDIAKIKAKDIDAKAQMFIDSLTPSYPEYEKLTFERQEREARAYLADNAVSTPALSIIAAVRGLSVLDIAQRVEAKADAFSKLAMTVAAQRQHYQDQLSALLQTEDQAAIEGFVVNYELPS